MASQVVQIAVLKQGVWDKGSWSTRILTLDVATATATVSRKHHPKNLLYHSLQLDMVQMWPHFTQRDIEDYINSIEAKMTLRLIGKVVPVPNLSSRQVLTAAASAEAAAAADSVTSSTRSAGSAAPTATATRTPSKSLSSKDYGVIACNGAKKQRPVDAASGAPEVWMIRFTTYQSYELALVMMNAMRTESGQPRHLLANKAVQDLQVIRTAWLRRGGAAGLNAETAKT